MIAADSRLSSTTIERKRGYVKEVEKSSLQEEQGVLKSVDAILEEYIGKRKRRRPIRTRTLSADP
jgi:hypothetical protein